ncbi:MAG: hypothetical protein E7420_00470 [Ruminococcaceae bacterium]|nr:hypothetical protein [Oscillospiraceae bacterium]
MPSAGAAGAGSAGAAGAAGSAGAAGAAGASLPQAANRPQQRTATRRSAITFFIFLPPDFLIQKAFA